MTSADGRGARGGDARLRDGAILFAATFLLLAAGAFWGLPSGKSVAGALVILDGGVPYRDFWSMYAPGQFYAVALLFWLFGRELLVPALAAAALHAVSALLVFLLLLRLGAGRWTAFCAAVVAALMFWTTAPELTDYQLALPCVLLALGHVVRYYLGDGPAGLGRAGLWLGLAAWAKHDIAAYVALGVVLSLAVSWWWSRGARPAGWRAPAGAGWRVAVAAMAAVAPIVAWTAWTAGDAAWADLFVFPSTVFSHVRGDRFPPLIPELQPLRVWTADVTNVRKALRASNAFATWIMLYVPAAAWLAGAAALLVRRPRLEPGAAAALTLFVLCIPFFWSAAHIQQNTHPYSMAILVAGIAVILWKGSAVSPDRARRWRAGAALLGGVYAAGLLATPATRLAAVHYEWEGSRALDLPGFSGIRVPARMYDAFNPTGRFFRTYTADDEAIYTGLVRHDAIVINNALLYAIAGRRACCGFTELHPGVADRAAAQAKIIERLEHSGVRAIALWRFGWADDVMDERRRRNLAATPDGASTSLDEYIAAHFETVSSHGEYRVLWRRDLPKPWLVADRRAAGGER